MSEILLVDDSAEIRMIVAMCLHGSGHRLDEAPDAAVALERIAKKRYDAILLDLELPGMSGLDCAREIRKRGGGSAAAPIIVLSGHSDPGHFEEASRAGCNAYVAKPIRKQALLEVLENQLGGSVSAAAPAAVDPALLDLVPGYLENRRKDIAVAREALASRQFAALKRIGHNMKGTGPTYGFPDLGALGARIEAEAVAGDAQRLAVSIDELDRILSQRAR